MVSDNLHVTVIGGGLAGSEAALQLARRGIRVTLIEMRPEVTTPAHHSGDLAELLCSNSLKSDDPSTAAGQFKRELSVLGSELLEVARLHAVPAGAALAVDRQAFAGEVTRRIESHPLIDVERAEARSIPNEGPVIVASGPLTSAGLESSLSELVGGSRLSFFDAAAPIIEADSIDRSVVFAASRWDKGEGADYLNAPMDRSEYEAFYEALVGAERVHLKEFERRELFAACQPVEEVARSGPDALRFGALKPVGLTDPRTGLRPWAVVQLRAENRVASAYNLVGFQTNLTFAEQRRVLRMIPGLQDAEFARYGVMHRNTFIDAPRTLTPGLAVRSEPRVWLAGQLTGTEGYLEAVGSGLLAALNVFAWLKGAEPAVLPTTTVFGALLEYATSADTTDYQPMHVNYGIIPPLPNRVRGKRERYTAYADRAQRDLQLWVDGRSDLFGA